MKESIKMIMVLSLICAVCSFVLAFIHKGTKERIQEQVLINVKGPAVETVLSGSENELIKDRKEYDVDSGKLQVFTGNKSNAPWAVAFETFAGGFGGDVGVVVGFNLEDDTLTGIGITTHKETPGVGSKIGEPTFSNAFKDKSIDDTFKVKADGGVIDAITGATISSKAVCNAVEKAIPIYKELKEKL
ncbi:MAG: RnfABCDGE type electron transport complex subunit G [Pseudomonadota bacterium]